MTTPLWMPDNKTIDSSAFLVHPGHAVILFAVGLERHKLKQDSSQATTAQMVCVGRVVKMPPSFPRPGCGTPPPPPPDGDKPSVGDDTPLPPPHGFVGPSCPPSGWGGGFDYAPYPPEHPGHPRPDVPPPPGFYPAWSFYPPYMAPWIRRKPFHNRLVTFRLPDTDEVVEELVVSAEGCAGTCPWMLTQSSNLHIIGIPGVYRLHLNDDTAIGKVQVYAEQHDIHSLAPQVSSLFFS